MQRHEAAKLAETVSVEDLKQMFINAKSGIKDWQKISTVNKGLTKGTAFNVLTKVPLTDNMHILGKTNMIWEFGEWLPNYMKSEKIKRTFTPVHQEPDFTNFDAIITE